MNFSNCKDIFLINFEITTKCTFRKINHDPYTIQKNQFKMNQILNKKTKIIQFIEENTWKYLQLWKWIGKQIVAYPCSGIQLFSRKTVIDTSITVYRFQKSDVEGTQLDAKGNILSDSIYMKFY